MPIARGVEDAGKGALTRGFEAFFYPRMGAPDAMIFAMNPVVEVSSSAPISGRSDGSQAAFSARRIHLA